MGELQVYQVVLLVLAIWLVVALELQLSTLIRYAVDLVDWQVVAFRGALMFLGTVVVVRYVFEVNPWVLVVGWLVLDVAATANTIYIRSRVRRKITLPRDPED